MLLYFRGLVVRAWDEHGDVAGVRIEVEDGEPLVYADESGNADPELDETTSAGFAARIGLDAGKVTLTVHAPAGTDCGFETDSMMLRPSITIDLEQAVVHVLDVVCSPNE